MDNRDYFDNNYENNDAPSCSNTNFLIDDKKNCFKEKQANITPWSSPKKFFKHCVWTNFKSQIR